MVGGTDRSKDKGDQQALLCEFSLIFLGSKNSHSGLMNLNLPVLSGRQSEGIVHVSSPPPAKHLSRGDPQESVSCLNLTPT